MGWNDLEGLVQEAELDQGAEGQLWFVKVEERERRVSQAGGNNTEMFRTPTEQGSDHTGEDGEGMFLGVGGHHWESQDEEKTRNDILKNFILQEKKKHQNREIKINMSARHYVGWRKVVVEEI